MLLVILIPQLIPQDLHFVHVYSVLHRRESQEVVCV
jgi:hypothetical protein